MAMTHTDRSTVLAKAIKATIEASKDELGIDSIFYGDQNNLPKATTVTIEPGVKNRDLEGVGGVLTSGGNRSGGRTLNVMQVLINVYSSQYGSESDQRLRVQELAEEIEHLLHQDTSVGGIIIHGFVETWDPGMVFKAGTMFRAVQMTFTGQTKTMLTEQP